MISTASQQDKMRFPQATHLALTGVALSQLSTASSASHDYVIVGAGTAGLVLANRLSQDPSISVAVVDPGPDRRGNPTVENPQIWSELLGGPVDWSYESTPQAYADNRTLGYSAGKGIGGTTLINGNENPPLGAYGVLM